MRLVTAVRGKLVSVCRVPWCVWEAVRVEPECLCSAGANPGFLDMLGICGWNPGVHSLGWRISCLFLTYLKSVFVALFSVDVFVP